MDPFSITVGAIGIIQAVTACLKLSRKFIGPSTLSNTELIALNISLHEFHGVIRTFHTHLEIYHDDDSHIKSLEYLKPVIAQCNEAIGIVKAFMQDTSVLQKALRGSKFDRRLRVA
jgi:hypothetical protein